MKKLHLSLILSLFLSYSTFAFQVDTYNLTVGDSYHIKVNQSQEISQIIMGAPNTINTENESLELLEVEEVTSAGDYMLRLTVLEQKTVVSSPMMSMVEDTEKPDIGSGLYPALKNTSYTFIMSEKGRILGISGLEEIKKDLKSELAGNPQASAQIEALFSEELIRSTLELRFSFFPDTQTMNWSENKTLTMNAMPIEMATDYSYTNNYTIDAVSKITIEATTVQMGTNVDLKLNGKQNASYTLHEVSGIPLSFESVNDVSGNAAAAGMQIPMTIKTDTKTTFTLQK